MAAWPNDNVAHGSRIYSVDRGGGRVAGMRGLLRAGAGGRVAVGGVRLWLLVLSWGPFFNNFKSIID